MGNLMLTILACMAQMEREMMLQRQSEGIAAVHAAGRTVGRGNSAWIDWDGIIAARATGQSLRTVAKELEVSLSTVQRVLKEAAQ